MDPLISVIVPAYKTEPYLSNCLDSILVQNYDNIEIIVVDDGTPDGAGKIADRYVEQYPGRIISVHTVNQGVTHARLTGVRYSSGEWIGFVDGDDEIEPDMYERLIKNAQQYDPDISHCGYKTIVNGGERIHYFYNTGRLVQQSHTDGLRDLISGIFVEPSLCNKLFKRELMTRLINTDSINYSIRMNEDLLMNFQLFSFAGKSVYEDFCPYKYMARPDSYTRSNKEFCKDIIDVSEIIMNTCEPEVRTHAVLKYIRNCRYAYEYFMHENKYSTKVCKYKKELLKYKNYWKYLGRNERFKIVASLYCYPLYVIICDLYGKFLFKQHYE